jgi:hypothetical protein
MRVWCSITKGSPFRKRIGSLVSNAPLDIQKRLLPVEGDDDGDAPVRHPSMNGFDRDEKDLGDRPEESEVDDLLGIVAKAFEDIKVLRTDEGQLGAVDSRVKIGALSLVMDVW